MKYFLDYTGRVLVSWRSIFTLIPFLIGLGQTFSGRTVVFPTSAWYLLAALALYVSTFIAYRDLQRRMPSEGQLGLSCQFAQFGGHGWSSSMPMPPIRFILQLTLRNVGAQQATVTEIRPTLIKTGSSLISSTPRRLLLQDTTPGSWTVEVPLPWVVPSQYVNPHLRWEIQVELAESDPLQFARRLRELKDFRIQVACAYETLAGESRTIELEASGSFATFVDETIRRWKETKNHELVYEAKNV